MNRKITIGKLKLRKKSGVYKLNYGDHFYIGRSYNISGRLKSHYYEINDLLSGKKELIENHYLTKCVQFLKDNPSVNELSPEVLHYCEPEDMIAAEQKWLSLHKSNPACLNMGFVSKPSQYEIMCRDFEPITITEIISSPKEKHLYDIFKYNLQFLKDNPNKTAPILKQKYP